MFVLTSKSQNGQDLSASTVNWVTMTSFAPPLVAVGVKADSSSHAHITETGVSAVNVIGKEQVNLAFNFFKSHDPEGTSIGGESFEPGLEIGCPLLGNTPAWWECKVVGQVAHGDHTLFVGEVLEEGPRNEDNTILMRDRNLNYGG